MRVAAIPTYIESTDSLIPQHACRNESIIRTPPFPGKMINNYCIQSFRTLTFEIIIPISEHLHLAELDRESPNVYIQDFVFVELQRSLPNVY